MLAKTGADREMETASAGQEEKDDTSGVKLIDLEREREIISNHHLSLSASHVNHNSIVSLGDILQLSITIRGEEINSSLV